MKLLRNLTLALLGISIQLAPLHSGAMELTKQEHSDAMAFGKTYKGQITNIFYKEYKKPLCGGYSMGLVFADNFANMKNELEYAKLSRDKLRELTNSNSSQLYNRLAQETYNSNMNRLLQFQMPFTALSAMMALKRDTARVDNEPKSFEEVQEILESHFADPKSFESENAFFTSLFTTTKNQAFEITKKLNLDLTNKNSIVQVDTFLNNKSENCSVLTNLDTDINSTVNNVYGSIYKKLLFRNIGYLTKTALYITYSKDFQYEKMSPAQREKNVSDFLKNSMSSNDSSLKNKLNINHVQLMGKLSKDLFAEVLSKFMNNDYENYQPDEITAWLTE